MNDHWWERSSKWILVTLNEFGRASYRLKEYVSNDRKYIKEIILMNSVPNCSMVLPAKSRLFVCVGSSLPRHSVKKNIHPKLNMKITEHFSNKRYQLGRLLYELYRFSMKRLWNMFRKRKGELCPPGGFVLRSDFTRIESFMIFLVIGCYQYSQYVYWNVP